MILHFNPHSPCGERLVAAYPRVLSGRISIHTPHAGSDDLTLGKVIVNRISIHTPHAGSDLLLLTHQLQARISIHTPHAGSDVWHRAARRFLSNFNPHSPCGERLAHTIPQNRAPLFQSTLPMRGATQKWDDVYRQIVISIHTPHAGSDWRWKGEKEDNHISIHTPHAGSDQQARARQRQEHDFNPHSPCGERPRNLGGNQERCDFNPHSPCGERHDTTALTKDNIYEFQSTLPMRGATMFFSYFYQSL